MRKDMKQLFCFDFDNTIVKGHFHNKMSYSGLYPIVDDNVLVINGQSSSRLNNPQYDPQAVQRYTEDLLDIPNYEIRDIQQLQSLFKEILSHNHHIAVTSFTKYPDVIPITLKRLGLTDEQVSNINVIAGLPKDGPRDPRCKTEHIEKAMELSGVQDKSNVILIDDSLANINNAKAQGIGTIHVDANFKWDQVQQLISEHKTTKLEEVTLRPKVSVKPPPANHRHGMNKVLMQEVEQIKDVLDKQQLQNHTTSSSTNTIKKHNVPSRVPRF